MKHQRMLEIIEKHFYSTATYYRSSVSDSVASSGVAAVCESLNIKLKVPHI